MLVKNKSKAEYVTVPVDSVKVQPCPAGALRSQITKFLSVRKRTICFRIFNYVGLVFDIYAVYKKYERDEMIWVALSIICLITPALVGSLYSLYFYIRDGEEDVFSHKAVGKRLCTRNDPLRARKISSVSQLSNIESENSMDDFLDSIVESGDELDDTKSQASTTLSSMKRSIRMKLGDRPRLSRGGSQGTKAEIQIKPDLTHQSCTRQRSLPEANAESTTFYQEFKHLLHDFKDFLPTHRITALFHCLLMSREFRFYSTSVLLWDYIVDMPTSPEEQVPIRSLESKYVKQVCFVQKWYFFIKAEATARQINLLMSTLENVLMTMIQLLYWSSRHEIDPVSLDPMEFISIFTACIQIAYNIVSTYNHQRELNCLKQDMSFLHKAWMTFTHLFFIVSRMLTFYTFLCLGKEALVFLLTILSMQVLNYLNSVREVHYSNDTTPKTLSTASVIVSSILLIFIYAPASTTSSKRTLTKNSYEKNMLLESISIIVFSLVHIDSHGVEGMTWLTMEITQKLILIGYFIAFVCYVIGMMMGFGATFMFKYCHITEGHILNAIEEVNSEFGTRFRYLKNDYNAEVVSTGLIRGIRGMRSSL